MKSSVRILAIALALAFLLLARTAFQDDSTASAAAIKIDDGEAAFSDQASSTQEAKYVGFGESGTSTTVVFYVNSEDLGTTVTARTSSDDASNNTPDGSSLTIDRDGNVLTLQGGITAPGTVANVGAAANAEDGDDVGTTTPETGSILALIDAAYCEMNATTSLTIQRGTEADQDPLDAGDLADRMVVLTVPDDWGVVPGTATTTADDGTTVMLDVCRGTDERNDGTATTPNDAVTATGDYRKMVGEDIRTTEVETEETWAENHNHARYEYKPGDSWVAYSKVNKDRRYTHGTLVGAGTTPATRDMTGGEFRPLTGTVKVTEVDNGTTFSIGTGTTTRDVPNAITNPDTGQVTTLLAITDGLAAEDGLRMQFTFDIVDVYEDEEGDDDKAYPDYTSGYERALITGSSDSRGLFVKLTEVDDVGVDETDMAPASNVFRGEVMVTNVPGADSSMYLYAQDGDTLTLTVVSKNGDRNSDALATATVLVDDSPPEVDNLTPADKTVTSDDGVSINFTINDSGAGLKLDGRSNVQSINLYAQDDEGDSITGADDRDTADCQLAGAGDSALTPVAATKGSVSLAFSPSNTDYSDCADVNTRTLGKNSHGLPFNIEIKVEDLAGNVTTETAQLTVDTEPPSALSGQAGKGWDSDDNKAANSGDSILVKFDESLDPDTVTASDVTVAGYTVDSVEVVGVNAKKANEGNKNQNLNEYIHITLTEDLAKNASPNVTISGVTDVAGNDSESQIVRADNKIAPVVTVVPFAALVGKDGEQAVSFTADEVLSQSAHGEDTKASVNSDISTLKIKVSADTMGGAGTFEQDDFDKSGAYGVMLQAVDVNGNPKMAGAVSVSDEDVKLDLDDAKEADGTFKVKLANWPPADSDLDGKFTGEVVAKVDGDEVASSTENVYFDGDNAGMVELMVNAGESVGKAATLSLSYKYVNADQVIQVDVDEPTLTSIPADNAETDYAAGAIQFIWAEDKEYAGDTYEKVTLNEASHEGPNGTSTDILDKLSTNDNKKWVFRPAADLALGDHEFTLKATDAAGNSNEVSVTITVIERKPVKIDLGPGWNLISLPGMPASADVNDVFSSDTVSVISQYDGRRVSPWTVWTRGSDGSLSSSPAGRTTIDSGLGLWVLSSDGSALEVDIPGTSKDSPAGVLPPSIDLIVGWNLVAVILIGDRTEVGVNEYLPQGVWTRAFRLNNTTGQFESFSPIPADDKGTFADDPDLLLESGDALWVYATVKGVIVPK